MTSVEPLSMMKSPPIAKEDEDEIDTVTEAKHQHIVITRTQQTNFSK